MFWTLMIILHVMVCILMILMILLQSGKGADIGAVFGGGSSQTVFGSSGAGTFLSKLTIGGAILFMVTSITLSYFAGGGVSTSESVMEGVAGPPPQTAPVQPGGKEAPAATTGEVEAEQPSSPAEPPTEE
jgi:preprotein translocase subunit SecG